MTSLERDLLRRAIDARVRARRQAFIDAGELRVCSACGCDSDQQTAGCRHCSDRHRSYRRHRDLDYRRWYNESRKRRRARLRATAS